MHLDSSPTLIGWCRYDEDVDGHVNGDAHDHGDADADDDGKSDYDWRRFVIPWRQQALAWGTARYRHDFRWRCPGMPHHIK